MAIETLRDVYATGGRIYIRCAWGKREGLKTIRECGFLAELDVMTMMITRGRACRIEDLPYKVRCPKCGSPRVAVTISYPGNATIAAARAGGDHNT